MKMFELDVQTLLLRFFLMQGLVLLGGFINQWWIAVLALPILLSCMLGIKFKNNKS
jgi:hypothetical protein